MGCKCKWSRFWLIIVYQITTEARYLDKMAHVNDDEVFLITNEAVEVAWELMVAMNSTIANLKIISQYGNGEQLIHWWLSDKINHNEAQCTWVSRL